MRAYRGLSRPFSNTLWPERGQRVTSGGDNTARVMSRLGVACEAIGRCARWWGRVTPRRELPLLLFSIVFATSLTGLLNVTWWAAVVGGCALALALIAEERDEGLIAGATAALSLATTLSSLLIATGAAVAAFGLGRVTALVWGV